MIPGGTKVVHLCPAGHKSTTKDYYKCQKCCKNCFTRCVCHIRFCRKCNKDCAYELCRCEREKMFEKEQKELSDQFNELQKKEKDALDQMEKINAIRNQIREELLRLQGEFRALEKLKTKGGESESGESDSIEANRRGSKVVGAVGVSNSI